MSRVVTLRRLEIFFESSPDLTSTEANAYGKDGTHYFNERIAERSAFQEGFADYGQFVLEPSLVERYRPTLEEIKLEGDNGYSQVKASDTALPALDLLRVEGVVALAMVRMSQTIPDGRQKILAAFKASNAPENTFPRFLKTFASQNPDSVASVAAALDALAEVAVQADDGGRVQDGAAFLGLGRFVAPELDPAPAGHFPSRGLGERWASLPACCNRGATWSFRVRPNRCHSSIAMGVVAPNSFVVVRNRLNP